MLYSRTTGVAFFAIPLLVPTFAAALAVAGAPASCVQLYELPTGTINFPDGTGALTDEACTAKLELLRRQDCVTGPGITGASSPKECIRGLDNDFAIALAKAFREERELANTNVHSGYRTPQGDRLVSGNSSGFGNHTRGCAVDLNRGTWSQTVCGAECQHIKAHSARLRLSIPLFPSHPSEANHVEFTGVCRGSPGARVDTPPPYIYRPPGQFMPPTGMFGQPPPQNMFGQPGGFPQQNIPAAQNPFSYMQPTPAPPPVSASINPSGPTNPTAIEQIAQIANPPPPPSAASSTPIGTGTPITLITGISNIGTLQGQHATTATSGASYQGGFVAVQTFVSRDLRDQPVRTPSFFGLNTIFILLENIKQMLLGILARLGLAPAVATSTPAAVDTFMEVGH